MRLGDDAFMSEPIIPQDEDIIEEERDADPYDGVPLGVECAWPVELLS